MPSSPPPKDDADADADAGRVLAPEDLDIERLENVVPIDEGRYVIASDETDAESIDATSAEEALDRGATDVDGRGDSDAGERSDEVRKKSDDAKGSDDGSILGGDVDPSDSEERVRRWQERALRGDDSHYALRLSAKSGETVAHRHLSSDDVAAIFDDLLSWYAGQLDREMPVEDVLGILLAESDVRVRYPLGTVRELLGARGLSLDDSIAELFETAADDRGLVFPPDDRSSGFIFPSDENGEGSDPGSAP